MKKLIIFMMVFAVGLSSCQKFEDLEKDPNRPGDVPPSLVFTRVLYKLYYSPWSDQMRWGQFHCSNYAYYDDQEYDWTTTDFNYNQLKNVNQMISEATRVGLADNNPYSAIGKFFKAYFFVDMSLRLGDVPMTDALKSLENTAPKYDTQKAVFKQALTWLEESNTELQTLINSNDQSLTGDFMLGNDLKKWQKVVNSYKLRVLIALSKKESDTDLNIKAQFANVVNNPTKYPVMTSLDDNLKFTYNSSDTKYPLNQDNYGQTATRNNMAATYLNTLVSLKDPRTFIVADPAPAKIKAGLTASDYEAYVGASSGESLDDMSTKMLNGEYSPISKSHYYSSYLGEPCIQIGYSEVCFSIAEAINRGWVAGNAEDYYTKGIKASWTFHGVTDVETKWTAYYAQPSVKLSSTSASALTQILTQKYLAFFQNSGWEAYNNYRRTGVPTFLTGPGTANSGRIAKRWQYPSSERTTNATNYNAALTSQFGAATDDINSEMWIIK
ncbi:SusD/RagB family nutrient-binding outer membrane lipoprotein [Aquipluma nitroreducens]|nr:SusD/RagB family nutrient-binding outer membrane lipoprotein [Aquipluma nitroreducens]